MDRDVLSELRDARTIINDGCNERGTLLSGERCKACVRYIDHAILLLKEREDEKKRIMKVIWDTLHEGFSIDTVADQDWVYEQIRHRIEDT